MFRNSQQVHRIDPRTGRHLPPILVLDQPHEREVLEKLMAPRRLAELREWVDWRRACERTRDANRGEG